MLKIKTADPFVSGCLSTERKRLSLFTSHDRDHLQDKYSQLKDLHGGQISPHSSVSGCGSCIIYFDESISCLSPVSLQFLSSESSDISCPPKKKSYVNNFLLCLLFLFMKGKLCGHYQLILKVVPSFNCFARFASFEKTGPTEGEVHSLFADVRKGPV